MIVCTTVIGQVRIEMSSRYLPENFRNDMRHFKDGMKISFPIK